ncbi:diguanylate cyclase [Caproiciproducens sp.]
MKKQRVWWQRLLSVPLMIFFILAVYGLKVPNPMILLIIPVVYFTYSDGYVSGALSGATSIAYAFYFFLVKTADPAGGYKAITIVLAVVSIILLVGKLKAREQRNVTELKRHEKTLAHMAMTDELTGASNRHAFFELANTIYENSRRLGQPISLLFIDIDYFKQINDCYGHVFGDAVLARLSQTLENCLRSGDVNCRYGGEEFLLLLAGADGDASRLVARRIMDRVRMIRFEEVPDFRFTISIGVSSMIPVDPPGIDLLIRSADNAMYQAKQAGRNQIAVENPEPDKEIDACSLRPLSVSAGSRGDACAPVEVSDPIQDILLQILEQMLEIVSVVDADTHEILYVNSAAREKYGIADLKNRKCYQLIQGLDKPCAFCVNGRLSYDSVYTWNFTNQKTGRHFLLRDRLVYWSGRKARLEIATDITETEEERHTLESLLESEQVVRECMGMLYSAKTMDEAMEKVLRRTGEYSGADRACFYSLSGEAFILANQWCAPQLSPDLRKQKAALADFHRLWSLFGNKECVLIEDTEQLRPLDRKLYQSFLKQKIKNIVLIPLERDGKLLGLWGVENPLLGKAHGIASSLLSLHYFLLSTMQRVRYETLLKKLSFEDSLTGLRNRNRCLRDIADLGAAPNTGVVSVSMNEMKRLNDTLGHACGDQILRNCADRIRETFPSGLSYRVNGDEFIVLCREIPQKRFEQQVRTFMMDCTVSQDCHAAIGYHWTEQAENVRSLIREAEAWMYEDKKRYYRKILPSDRYRHYNDDVFCLTEPGALKKRMEEGCFVVYLQPKVSFKNRIMSGAEALIRYRQEDGTVIAPAQFLPVLEDAKLIGVVDFFVFDRICAMLAQWIGEGRAVVPISVNFSRYTMAEQDFLSRLQEVFGRYSIEKKWVIIEVTESVKGVEDMNLLTLIDSLRAAGFSISIDDFGVDFANLSLFSSANFDELKLDKALVDSVLTNQKAQLVIESIVSICRKMGICVVAEGVETEEQFDILRQNGCEQAQGYLFSKPIPIGEYVEKYMTVPAEIHK